LCEWTKRRAFPLQIARADLPPTFVMIGQNRADAKRQVVAKLQWRTAQEVSDGGRAFFADLGTAA
jgi:hypothetical protein